MSKVGLIYHTDFNGLPIKNSATDVLEASKLYDELIILSADTRNVGVKRTKARIKDILDKIPLNTKVVLGTAGLLDDNQFIPNLKAFRGEYRHIEFTGVYFNEESFFHPRFYRAWRALNKIKEKTVWIPYTGSWEHEIFTLPQIGLLYRKFDRIYLQPNYFQARYGKERWQLRNLHRFIKNHGLGVEFEIDGTGIADLESYLRASEYFLHFNDIKDKAFYTGGMNVNRLKEFYPAYHQKIQDIK